MVHFCHDSAFVAGICDECVLARIRVEAVELLRYENATIFVRKIVVTGSSCDKPRDTGKSGNTALSECKDDPDYQVSGRFGLSDCIAHDTPLDSKLVKKYPEECRLQGYYAAWLL
jgi:hypothetical protein